MELRPSNWNVGVEGDFGNVSSLFGGNWLVSDFVDIFIGRSAFAIECGCNTTLSNR